MNRDITASPNAKEHLEGDFRRVTTDSSSPREFGPIKVEPVSKFQCAVYQLSAKITRSEARERMLQALSKSPKMLPQSETPESVAAKIQDVLVPHWLQAGTITGLWRANGVLVDRREIKCPSCDGKGRTGREPNRRTCSDCHGRKKKTLVKKKHTLERGQSSAELALEIAPNYTGPIRINPEPLAASQAEPLTAAQAGMLYCANPDNFATADQQIALGEKLAETLQEKIKRSLLRTYHEVDGIALDYQSTSLTGEVNALLYPAYVSWYSRDDKDFYVVCDAVTGKVTMPSKVGYYTKRAFALLVKTTATIVAILVVMAIVGAIVGPQVKKPDSPENKTQRAATSDVVASGSATSVASAGAPLPPGVDIRSDGKQVADSASMQQSASPSVSHSPSFDCARSATFAEKAICGDARLSKLDAMLAENYEALLASPVDKPGLAEIRESQRAWLAERNLCASDACIKQAYLKRLEQLCTHPSGAGMGLTCTE